MNWYKSLYLHLRGGKLITKLTIAKAICGRKKDKKGKNQLAYSLIIHYYFFLKNAGNNIFLKKSLTGISLPVNNSYSLFSKPCLAIL